ncbi:pyridoxamine 5'-phosphate oxidase family protein [Gordonia sp. zg691]|uniref:Pyridoxamine 5'-phosphate oxidase family protein n=1 Tax=Gordonia jinghuaiqii TaxID=2758710 RepID=A0A7D7LUK9_9ACTN|nr:pyridoxamine 5'-phosphate oxidase family protein [Gordonia jinghuaiqii]MBD0863807.1 pyridoxamine 5'-phosphate oxidase family protein [Gordonia jinghuaiqii]MCR5979971.1 pyridoxamine 5'-phosphate oxidase family protein [Gordonia jinghuaiqii]QMT03805.1 pyridoxamine 5'-phosphate oxidase family protein [Gordonia jinghuaiqii]
MVDNPVQVLTADEAWNLLGSTELGRIGLSVNGQPDIFPVNYHAGDGRILLRTGEGTKLAELVVNSRVVFESDGHTDTGGWSVVAKGTARVLTSLREIEEADRLPLRPWIPTMKYNYVEIVVEEISARRFEFGPEPERYPV